MTGGEQEQKSQSVNGHWKVGQRDLPVRRHKVRIVEKVSENRVTLIFADTGSGKSSQVPQILLEAGSGPILCTQPRRLAVVAVAKRVAEERGCVLGEEVGYQIGQVNRSTTRSKILFKTAGILFEELRTNGIAALSKFKVVILDEVHERSVESDLVLTCLKQLLRTTTMKLVLMSATADLLKYEEYFKEIDRGEGVEKIAIQNLGEKLQSIIVNTKVAYLEQVVKLLGSLPPHQTLLDNMSANFSPVERGIELGNLTHNTIRDLIVYLHKNEIDLSKNVLVFLPTYRALEQQWLLLEATKEPFELFVLHSSIDMENSIRAMEVCPLKRRKIILATNVAESSVTIPGVSFVIDSCRSLEVVWDRATKKHQPRIVWVSESQAIQRKGRTGRTCDGVVYRMVPRNHFLRFEKFETPAMQLLSLRKQVLMILSASPKALNDPMSLLRKCMNPPSTDTVTDALDTLEDMDAIQMDARGRHQPTLYGRLLVSLPLSLESSVMVVRGGQLGYPRESAMLACILDATPNPVAKEFGNPFTYVSNLENYYRPLNGREIPGLLPHSTIMLANMYAYEFWQRSFKDKQRVESLAQLARGCRDPGVTRTSEDDGELQWCNAHHLSLTSLRAVAETMKAVMEALHRFRPRFLNKISGPPSYYQAAECKHVCSFHTGNSSLCEATNGNAIDAWDDWSFQESELVSPYEKDNETAHVDVKGNVNNLGGRDDEAIPKKCCTLPYTWAGTFHTLEDERMLSALIVEVQHGSQVFTAAKPGEETLGTICSDDTPLCSFFVKGTCMKGARCMYSHAKSAKPVPCRFFLSSTGCRYGNSCNFLHDDAHNFVLPENVEPINFDEAQPNALAMLDLLPNLAENEYLLLFGEGDFSFAESLSTYVNAKNIFATSINEESVFWSDPALAERLQNLLRLQMQFLWNVDVTALVTCSIQDKLSVSESLIQLIPWSQVRCVLWNFPYADAEEDIAEQQELSHQELMHKFFASLSIIMASLKLESIPVIITLCNDQFCRWRVESAARMCFFFLKTSVPFDINMIGGYHPMRNNLQSTFPVEKALIYVFELHPPKDMDHGVLWNQIGDPIR